MASAYPLPPITTPFWVSASGGRTSMMMARLIQQAFPGANIPFVFSNTGEEHPATLEFVKDCQEHWDMPIVWVEAEVHHGERRACTHKIVDYATAKRSGMGGPFEEVVKKYGLPSKMYPHCTRELKINPMYSYIRSIGFEGKSAVGIRGDEPKRLGKDSNIVYPMAHWWPTTKQEVLDWWADQPFDLQLAGEEEGNCLWCWQKSDKKHAINLERNPQWYDFPTYLEANYADIKAPIEPRRIFRGGRSTLQLIETINLN